MIRKPSIKTLSQVFAHPKQARTIFDMGLACLPAGQYKPRQTFDFDGRQWSIYAVAHTGKTLQARAYGYPWRDETFSIEQLENAE